MFKSEMPDFIGNASVICYAVINLVIPTGNTQHFKNGRPLGLAYGLAICQSQPAQGYYLFCCDDNWKEFADTWHETIEDAQDQAEYEYAGVSNNWNFK